VSSRHRVALIAASFIVAVGQGCGFFGRADPESIAARFPADSLRGVVEALAAIDPPRNAEHPESMEQAARFIATRLDAAGLRPELQPFEVAGTTFHNVSALIGTGARRRVVVGAHYDVFGDRPGADDNASGVAVLLRVAARLARQSLPADVEFVAYALEEPPHFRTADMGSARHAAALAAARVEVIAMLSLEMLGYYSDESKSQKYPDANLARYFPSIGNFIAVVGRSADRPIVDVVHIAMNRTADPKVYAISGPPEMPGVDLSDHASYWIHGVAGLMITDTAHYRNPHYHMESDRPATLDYSRMDNAAESVEAAVVALTNVSPPREP
jgi:Zn-dependent M28 family amino/carboxypeptidase